MFRLSQSDRFWYPVHVDLVEEDGQRKTHRFDVLFRRMRRSEFQETVRRIESGELTDEHLVHDVLLGWRGVQDSNGHDLEITEENKAKLLDVWPVLPAIAAAFIEAHSLEGLEKN